MKDGRCVEGLLPTPRLDVAMYVGFQTMHSEHPVTLRFVVPEGKIPEGNAGIVAHFSTSGHVLGRTGSSMKARADMFRSSIVQQSTDLVPAQIPYR